MIGPHVGRDYFVNLSRKEADNDSRSLEEGRMSIAKHIEAATKEAAMYGYKPKTFQIFVAGPQKLKIRMESDEIDELHSYIKKTKIRVIAHSAFADSPTPSVPGSKKGAHAKGAAACTREAVFPTVGFLSCRCGDGDVC